MSEPQVIDTAEGRFINDWLSHYERECPETFRFAGPLLSLALRDAWAAGQRHGSIRMFDELCDRHEAVDNAMHDELHTESQDAQHGSTGTDAQQGGAS